MIISLDDYLGSSATILGNPATGTVPSGNCSSVGSAGGMGTYYYC